MEIFPQSAPTASRSGRPRSSRRLSPEGGEEGGRLVASGTPEDVAGVPDSHTSRFLAELVTPAAPKARRGRSRAKTAAAA